MSFFRSSNSIRRWAVVGSSRRCGNSRKAQFVFPRVMALSAAEALTLREQEHFELVISDIVVPEMDGCALANALRALTRYATIPMIAITGFAAYDHRDRALSAGFNTHLKKLVDPMKLSQLLEEFFPTKKPSAFQTTYQQATVR